MERIVIGILGFVVLVYGQIILNSFWLRLKRRKTENLEKKTQPVTGLPTKIIELKKISQKDLEHRTKNAILLLYISYGKDYVNALSEKKFEDLVAEALKLLDGDIKKEDAVNDNSELKNSEL